MKKYPQIVVPSHYLLNATYICTGRNNTPVATEFCFYYDDIYPLKRVKAFKEQYSLFIPNKPHKILRQVYGKNYMIPETKGYKTLVCHFNPKYTISVVSMIYVFVNCFFLFHLVRF